MTLLVDEQKFAIRQRKNCPKVLEFANESRKEGEFVDVTVTTGRTSIPANKLILSYFSPVFRQLFETQLKESSDSVANITVADVEANSVKALIDFAYEGTIIINNENALQLLAAADHLQMNEPKQFCVEFLRSILSPVNCFSILRASNFYRIESLQSSIYKMISDRLSELVNSIDFKSLSKDDIISCLSVVDCTQAKDITVYQAVVSWTKYDKPNRKNYFFELLHLVNFDNLPKEFLRDIVSKENLVKENLSCMRLVMEVFCKLLGSAQVIETESKILSFGGWFTPDEVFEVYRCDKVQKSVYLKLPFDWKIGSVLKLHDYIYFVKGNRPFFSWQEVATPVHVVRMKVDQLSTNTEIEKVAPVKEVGNCTSAAVFCNALVVTIVTASTCSRESYLPQQNTWKSIASTNQEKRHDVLVSCHGYLYDIGGCHDKKSLSCVERLGGLHRQWEFVQSMQSERNQHAAVSCSGCIYTTGGFNNETRALASVEKYDPSLNKWVYVKEMNFARHGHEACVLRDKIYVVGGLNAKDEIINEIECYDPNGDTWEIVGHTKEKLCNHLLIAV